MLITWIYTILVTRTYLAFASQLPSDIEKCHFGNGKCIARSMNYVIEHYGKTGIPAIMLPSLKALNLSNITFIQDDHGRTVWYEVNIFECQIKGLENTTITKVVGFGGDPHGGDIEIHGRVPSVVTSSKFYSKFKLFLVPFALSGISLADVQNFRFKLKMSFVRSNQGHAKIYKLSVKTKSDRWINDFKTVNSENTDLTILIADWMNENWSEIWHDAEPTVRAKIHETFIAHLNNIFSTIRYEDMFLMPDNKC